MTGSAHACVGAFVGALTGSPIKALAAGVVSHAICDIIPHNEAPRALDLVLAGAALGGIAAGFGARSAEFWGAVGATLPDAEHGLVLAGLMEEQHCLFPTHNGALPHGRDGGFLWQAAAAGAALTLAALFRTRRTR
ncbi:MAG: hypothetical protein KatS3mg024_1061 [Armatimonadota bacterium]|nr:MAG: hypothetical protein KatS3mg024_1061 [Armatimonadota bacterium]